MPREKTEYIEAGQTGRLEKSLAGEGSSYMVSRYFYKNGGPEWLRNGTSQKKIVTKLRQVEVLVGQGATRVDAIREVRIWADGEAR